MNIAREELSPEQKAIVEHRGGDLFVSACPGAGKTLAVVERFIARCVELPPLRGMAIVSFTRVATSEAEGRCHERGLSRLIGVPHFIGTLDSFVIRYLFVPLAQAKRKARVRVLDSWAALHAEVFLKGERGAGVPLDAFRFEGESAHFDEGRLTGEHQRRAREIARRRSDWEAAAKARRRVLRDAGFWSCDDVRKVVSGIILEPRWTFLREAIAARFDEIIVDEAQDCDEAQLQILGALRAAGLKLTLVADPDQAIYEFRNAKPKVLLETGSAMEQLRITGNRRGSPAICALANSMVASNRSDSHSVGASAACEYKVVVVPYGVRGERDAGTRFCEYAKSIGCTEQLVVAHQRSLANRSVGLDTGNDQRGGSAVALCRAAVQWRAPGVTPKERVECLRAAERVILRRLGVCIDDRRVEDVCEESGVGERWLRASGVTLLQTVGRLAAERDEAAYSEIRRWAEAGLGALDPPDAGEWAKAPGALFRSRGDLDGKEIRFRDGRSTQASDLPLVNTVHGVKGEGRDAVLLVFSSDPDRLNEILGAWESRTSDSEAKRVAYVAVTRAKRLVGLAVPDAATARVLSILKEASVPHETLSMSQAVGSVAQRSPRGRGSRSG